MLTITEAILKTKRQYKISGYKINCGQCEDFAMDICELLGLSIDIIEATEDFDLPGHYWIKFNGKHYDAECSKGVNSWEQLPIFKRYYKKIKA